MKKLVFLFVFIYFVLLLTLANETKNVSASGIQKNNIVNTSAQVATNSGHGSGVFFKNKNTTFVWTAAHVVAGARYAEFEIDPASKSIKFHIKYGKVLIKVNDIQDDKVVGVNNYFAQIIRFSDDLCDGHDLALLLLDKRDVNGIESVVFSDKSPSVLDRVICVGGSETHPHSVSEGIISGKNRFVSRVNNGVFGKLYDQVTLSALSGCSGGGVFTLSDNKCVGLLAAGIDNSECVNIIVPTRRIKDYCEKSDCMWAFDSNIKMPDNILSPDFLTDKPIPVSLLGIDTP